MPGSEHLHIGMVTWDYVPPIGGMGKHVADLVSGLTAAGHSVSVFSSRNLPLPFGRSILFSFLLPYPLRRFLKKHRPNLLHVHAGPGGVFLLRKPNNIPLIVTANHTYFDQVRSTGEQWKRFLIPFERRTYRLADAIICLSNDTADSLAFDYGIAREKLTVIGCGIDIARFENTDLPLSDRKRHCLFVGRSDRRKGFDLLKAAWHIVRKSLPDAELRIVGVSGISMPGVTFFPRRSDAELAALQGSSRIVICPSRLEGFGLAAAEAVVAGTPVLATNVPGLRSLITDGETGILSTLDPRELADKMIRLLTDDHLWQRLHEGCVRKRSSFDRAHEIEKHIHEYLRYTACR